MSDQREDSPTFVQTNLKLLIEQSSIFPFIGKSGTNKDGPEEKKEDGELWCNVEAQAAFLGPNLWDKTLPYDADLKYVDLDEFLSENGIPVDGSPQSTTTVVQQAMKQQQQLHHQQQQQHSPVPVVHQPQPMVLPPMSQRDSSVLELVAKRERSPSPSDTLSPTDTFNPPSPADSNEELKPQPMIKKSRKQDEKYWARRRKNNMAAKRSRDARRIKENQIALRAGFLEKENMGLRQEMDRLKKENMLLRDKLSKFSDV